MLSSQILKAMLRLCWLFFRSERLTLGRLGQLGRLGKLGRLGRCPQTVVLLRVDEAYATLDAPRCASRSPRSRSTSEHVGARRVCSSCKRKEYVLPASCLTCRAVPATCAWYSACPNFCFQEVTKLEIHTSRHQVSPWFQHVSTLHSEF